MNNPSNQIYAIERYVEIFLQSSYISYKSMSINPTVKGDVFFKMF